MLQAPTTRNATITEQPSLILRNPARFQQIIKAAFDYVFVAPTIAFLLPLFLLIAIIIKLESPGPVLHRRRVIGLRGRFFYAYNFRTTYVDGDSRLMRNREQWIALLNDGGEEYDPRLTRVGRLLRRFGLDDLPRLFNILNRQMSLVGPHLLRQSDIARLGMRRVEAITSVRPGLTGLWQVRMHSATIAERANLEIDYINNWSMSNDLQILLETLSAVWEGQIL